MNTDIATAYQATSEVLRALKLSDYNQGVSSSKAIDFINADAVHSTECLSRKIMAIADTDGNMTTPLDELATKASANGGFGEFAGFQSTVLDTAFALQAFSAAGRGGSATALKALIYLLNRQNSNGSWSDGEHISNVYTTALSVRAILPYVHQNSQAAESVRTAGRYLLSQQNSSGLWASDFESAQALLALVPSIPDRNILTRSIDSLINKQQADGSWGDDVYVTALVLQILAILDDPIINSDFSRLQGKILDGSTGYALDAVPVVINGPVVKQTLTDQDGSFVFADLPVGQYEMSIDHSGYAPLSGVTDLIVGKVTDLGELNLLPAAGNSRTGTMIGTVIDADTGLAIAGAKISSDSKITLTGTNGGYQLNNIAPGLVKVRADAPGYLGSSIEAQMIEGAVFLFSPRLTPGLVNTDISYLFGSIKEAESDLALAGVNVSLDDVPTGVTDGMGAYHIEPLIDGLTTVSASLPGYDTVSANIKIVSGNRYEFSPRLYRSGFTPAGANTASIKGTVMDAATNQPIGGISIRAHHNNIIDTLTTGDNGEFIVSGITDAELILEFIHPGYQSTVLNIPVLPLTYVDIGQIRLKPDSVTALLPDLVVALIDRQNLSVEPNNLKSKGTLQVTIKNQGTVKSADNVRLLAYYDSDKSGSYDAPVDSVLGETVLSKELSVNTSETGDIAVNGAIPFRDAPISIWVDSLRTVTESNENNNQLTTASGCQGRPLPSGTLDPVLKWHWDGSNYEPSYIQVMSTPVVAQLNDDNLDGLVNQADIPDIVFESFRGSDYLGQGLLRALSGKDGHEIWNHPTTPRWVSAFYGPAVGDIDHDGLVEIVISGPYQSSLMVFENNGDLKWSRSAGGAQPALADLDHDGEIEIIHGRSVFDSNGNLLWNASKGLFDPMPVIADLDNDGNLDVFAGGVAYNHDGTVKWNSGIGHFGSVIGNFDGDAYPEIVVKARTSDIYLLEHTGQVKWGPVAVPGGGGGPITVADFDGDDQPEIGTAGASYYVVFETDGSIKWLSPTQDVSSKATGSSLFDFEGDGKAEVLYGDEEYFRIFDGATGQVLFETPNSSDTLFEYPVVVDVDNDGHAEIVVVSNNYIRPGSAGIRVFENRSDNWMPTRSIWNQHAYHIDNINDDGSIPQYESASWLNHNTFRLNAFADRNVLDQVDLTAARLNLTDQGFGKPSRLSARIGNAGLADLSRSVTIAFQQGNPGKAKVLLGEASIKELAAGDFQDVVLENITLTNDEDVSAVVDPDARITECDENNNEVNIPLHSVSALGQIQVSLDAEEYGPEQPVKLSVLVKNTGALQAIFQAVIRIEDSGGHEVAELPPIDLPGLPGGDSASMQEPWNTGLILSGAYQIHGFLYNSAGNLLDEDTDFFSIANGKAPALEAKVTSDKAAYSMFDQVHLKATLINSSQNTILPPTLAHIAIRSPSGEMAFSNDLTVRELTPGAQIELTSVYDLKDAASGTYQVELRINDTDTEQLLAVSRAEFGVNRQLVDALRGEVIASPTLPYQGSPVSCTETVTYVSSTESNPVQLRSQLINLNSGHVFDESVRTVSLANGQTLTQVRSISTDKLSAGAYACLLTGEMDGVSRRLAAAGFEIKSVPVRIDADLDQGDRGRVLILMDPEADRNYRIDRIDPEDVRTESPSLSVQRQTLETLMAKDGWSFTIVTNQAEFVIQLHTGGYTVYLLLSETVKLGESIQKELREAVYRGEGLIEAGSHDQRQGRIDAILGIKFLGKQSDRKGITVLSTDVYPPADAALNLSDNALRASVRNAKVIGLYANSVEPAMTSHQYGSGVADYFGFDLLAEASFPGSDPLFSELLLGALDHVHPQSLKPLAGGVFPLRLRLINRGIGTKGQATVTLPSGVEVLDKGKADLIGNTLIWPFEIISEQTLTFDSWISLPESPVDISALIRTGMSPDFTEFDKPVLSLTPEPSPDVADLIAEARGLNAVSYKQVIKYLEWAGQSQSKGDYRGALSSLLHASDALIELNTSSGTALRKHVAEAIRAVSQKI